MPLVVMKKLMEKNDDDVMENLIVQWMDFFDGKNDSAKMDFL